VKYVLAPTLDVGVVVLLDSLLSHMMDGVWGSVFECGVFVWFLSVYLPDFDPVELMWSKVKAVLRKFKARTHEELQKALRVALDAIALVDIKNWFKHDGYNC